MAEDASIRRSNLKRLCRIWKWSPKDLHTALGGTYSYWRDLMIDSDKSFGEKIARRIEHRLELPRNWLDLDLEVPAAQHVAEAPPAPTFGPPRWLFSDELYAAVCRLADDDRARIERLVRAHLGLPSRDAET